MATRRAALTLPLAVVAALGIGACGGDDGDSTPDPASASTASASAGEEAGIRVVSPTAAAATIADPPADLVVLDVRTPGEFRDGHIEGAMLLDYQRDDFAGELATLDRDVPYVLYCRSGNRSAGARELMTELGFTSVMDIDGGIVAWQAAGLPLATG